MRYYPSVPSGFTSDQLFLFASVFFPSVVFAYYIFRPMSSHLDFVCPTEIGRRPGLARRLLCEAPLCFREGAILGFPIPWYTL